MHAYNKARGYLQQGSVSVRACVLLIHFMTAAAMHLTSLAHSPTSGILLPELLVGEGLSSADGRGTSSSIGVAIVNGRFPVSKPTPLYSHVATPRLSRKIFGRSLLPGENTGFLSHLYVKMTYFTKTGSGQR